MRVVAITKVTREPERQPDEDGTMDMLLRIKSDGAYQSIYPRINTNTTHVIQAYSIAKALQNVLMTNIPTDTMLYNGVKYCIRVMFKKRRARKIQFEKSQTDLTSGLFDFHD